MLEADHLCGDPLTDSFNPAEGIGQPVVNKLEPIELPTDPAVREDRQPTADEVMGIENDSYGGFDPRLPY